MIRVVVLLAAFATAPAQAQEWRTDFERHTVPLEEIVSGGPSKDGIPAIDAPRFVGVDAASDWLAGREPVAVVRHGRATHIYPLQILMWHEIVNDIVGGRPVTVTFCPLCNTTIAFERTLGMDTVLDFGTTGRLRHSDLVMYDRLTESWWQQATGEAIVGALAGRRLTKVPAPVLAWVDARRAFPEARVLSRITGHARPYGRNPYVRYDSGRRPFSRFFRGEPDGRLPAMARVVVLDDRAGLAVPFDALRRVRVAHVEVERIPVVVWWAPGTASALDAATIADGQDVGAGVAFHATLDGRALTFCPLGTERFRDRQTGTVWSITGRAESGPLAGAQLEPAVHGNHFWFAWSVFKPETRLVEPDRLRCPDP